MGWTAVTRSNGNDRSPEERSLAQLKLAATTAEEAARWLRNSLVRLRTGHEVEFEIQSAEQALQVAIERISGNATEGPMAADDGSGGGRIAEPQVLSAPVFRRGQGRAAPPMNS
jgi:hypothetical protein